MWCLDYGPLLYQYELHTVQYSTVLYCTDSTVLFFELSRSTTIIHSLLLPPPPLPPALRHRLQRRPHFRLCLCLGSSHRCSLWSPSHLRDVSCAHGLASLSEGDRRRDDSLLILGVGHCLCRLRPLQAFCSVCHAKVLQVIAKEGERKRKMHCSQFARQEAKASVCLSLVSKRTFLANFESACLR